MLKESELAEKSAVVALFDTHEAAQEAVRELQRSGLASNLTECGKRVKIQKAENQITTLMPRSNLLCERSSDGSAPEARNPTTAWRPEVKQTNSAPVEFSCHAPNATAVFVEGTFNDLTPDATLLRPQANGKWTGTLQPHRAAMNTNSWLTGNGAASTNDFGTMNRVSEAS